MAGLSWIGLSTRRRNFSSLTAGSYSRSSAFCAWSAPRDGYGASGNLRASIPAGRYSAARNFGYTFARAAPFAGKALALAQGAPQVLGPPRAPTPSSWVPVREGRAAAPPRTLPRTVRSRADCRLSSAPHSKDSQCRRSSSSMRMTSI
jgi:hypothetical protein